MIDQVWDAWQLHLPDVAASSRPSVSTEADALAAVEELRQGLRARRLQELEATVDRYFHAPPRGQGTVLQPALDEEVSPALLNRYKEARYGRGGCFDRRVGPGMTIRAAICLTVDAAVFSDPGHLGGGNPSELEEGGDTKLAACLVGSIIRLWRAIPNARLLLRLWGGTIASLRDCREFEWRERYWPSACHFAQHLGEHDLQEAWRIIHQVCPSLGPPFSKEGNTIGLGGPLPPFHVDHWYAALPELRRHFTDRGDVWGIADLRAKVDAALEQEAARVVMSRADCQQENEPQPPTPGALPSVEATATAPPGSDHRPEEALPAPDQSQPIPLKDLYSVLTVGEQPILKTHLAIEMAWAQAGTVRLVLSGDLRYRLTPEKALAQFERLWDAHRTAAALLRIWGKEFTTLREFRTFEVGVTHAPSAHQAALDWVEETLRAVVLATLPGRSLDPYEPLPTVARSDFLAGLPPTSQPVRIGKRKTSP